MISKEEAVQKLKKAGLNVTNDHSMITILLSSDVSFQSGLKDVKAQLKKIEYESSFCVKYGNKESEALDSRGDESQNVIFNSDSSYEGNSKEEDSQEMIDELNHVDDFLSLEDDGQFTLDQYGLN